MFHVANENNRGDGPGFGSTDPDLIKRERIMREENGTRKKSSKYTKSSIFLNIKLLLGGVT